MATIDNVFILLSFATLLLIPFVAIIASLKKKKQIHYAVMIMAIAAAIWNLGALFYKMFPNDPMMLMIGEKLYFIGIIILPITVLFTGLLFAKTQISFTWKIYLIFITPIISIIMLFTNQYHHLFFSNYSLIPAEQLFGIYFYIHILYSYTCIIIGLIYLLKFTLKNFGFYSKQSSLIIFGILFALIADSFSTFKLFSWSSAVENISFAVTIICFILAIVKFDFLNIIPIALENAMDLISDNYIVINKELEIINFNKTFRGNFPGVNRKDGISDLIIKGNIFLVEESLLERFETSISAKEKTSFEIQREISGKKFFYDVDITPLFQKNNYIGTIILLKDITNIKNNMEQIIMLNEKLRNLANHDGLTQAYNRYFFEERLQQEINLVNKQQTYGQDIYKTADNFGLILFDIDYFKTYNDNNGHLAGDELLQTIVKVIKGIIFPTDILCRYGGEEFAIICCKTSFDGIKRVAEKIRKVVEEYEFKFQEMQPNGNLTISIGVSYCSTSDIDRDELIKNADDNLYSAKKNGRNKIVFN